MNSTARAHNVVILESEGGAWETGFGRHPKTNPGVIFSGIFVAVPHTNPEIAYSVKVKVKFTLEQATKAQKESRGIAVLFL